MICSSHVAIATFMYVFMTGLVIFTLMNLHHLDETVLYFTICLFIKSFLIQME